MENARSENEHRLTMVSVTIKAEENTETEAGRLTRKIMGMLTAVWLCALCSACGNLTQQEDGSVETQEITVEAPEKYKEYDGYGCCDQNGHLKYYIEIGDEFRLHCFFQSGSPEYEEEVYTLHLPEENETGEFVIRQITGENGQDLSDSFSMLKMNFEPGQVRMQVERKEERMAGGDSDNIRTGEYLLLPGQENEQRMQATPMESGELLAMARAGYERESGFLAPEAECQAKGDGTYTIHLYEIVPQEDGSWHTATSCWYTVNAFGEGTDDVMGGQIQLQELSPAEVAKYLPAPVKLTYLQEGETVNEWEITDTDIIRGCLEALQQITIGKQTDQRAADAGETFCFALADGSTWTVCFEGGRLLRGSVCYETDGYKEVHGIVTDYLTEEGLQ